MARRTIDGGLGLGGTLLLVAACTASSQGGDGISGGDAASDSAGASAGEDTDTAGETISSTSDTDGTGSDGTTGNDDTGTTEPEPPEPGQWDWRDAVIYFVFVDRFDNGDPDNDGPIGGGVDHRADYQGGDYAGVIAQIEDGYFEGLGVNTLWITAPMGNTDSAGLGIGGDDHSYSAYHGYWPSEMTETEEHFGTMDELQQLVDTAHDHDLKVIVDYVMNHVHEESSVYTEHPDWFTEPCLCGSNECPWDGPTAQTCWFTDYLPSFDHNNGEARAFSVDNAIWWAQTLDLDGFRLDAVKHVADQWVLDLRARLTAEVESDEERFYLVGETFTGDPQAIAYYVRDDMLDGQFDFPLRTQIVEKILLRQGSMSDLAGFMDANDATYWSGGTMSTFIGNHDLPRVIHYAEDNPLAGSDPWWNDKDMGWTQPPTTPAGASAFERVGLGFTLLMTTPGAPLIYYGDEIGLPGAGDPDNRRFMDWNEDGYTDGQHLLRDQLQILTSVRADHPAMRYGDRQTLHADGETMVFAMRLEHEELGEEVFVALNRADFDVETSGIPDGTYDDELSGQEITVSGGVAPLPARSALILVPQ
jgi:glycosidase